MARLPKTVARRAPRALIAAALAVVAVVAGIVAAPTAAAPADAADLSKFVPGDIISDDVFFDTSTMTQAQIQAFLVGKVSTCKPIADGPTCLKDYYTSSTTMPASPMCAAYAGSSSERASAIISKVAMTCGINPRVLLVMLQKEQGLVTSATPTPTMYMKAMGADCPDTAPCDGATAGFFAQVHKAAWQLKRYANPPGTSNYFTWYTPGSTWNIHYHPDFKDPVTGNYVDRCGTTPVFIKNQATANLYYYTPYTPNTASLNAGYNTSSDTCASYGNRNFYNYFTDWFGSTHYSTFSSAPTPTISGTAQAGQILTATIGTWTATPSTLAIQWLRGGVAVSGATATTYSVTNDDAAETLSVRVTAARANYYTTVRTSTTVNASGYAVSRLSGPDRYATAVAVSMAAHPGPVPVVYLATGSGFADALAAAPVAAKKGGSLLLTSATALPSVVIGELQRLAPESVVIVGSDGVLDSGTEARVQKVLPNASVSRIAGTDRYDTARRLAGTIGTSPTVFVATGLDFPDALGAAAVAGGIGAPVVLVDGRNNTVDQATMDQITHLGATKAVIVGSAAVVSTGIAGALAAKLSVVRYGGADRYATNALLNDASFGPASPRLFAATGLDFPDALTGSVYAGQLDAPLFVTPGTCAAAPMADFLDTHSGSAVTLVGGDPVLGADVARLRRC